MHGRRGSEGHKRLGLQIWLLGLELHGLQIPIFSEILEHSGRLFYA